MPSNRNLWQLEKVKGTLIKCSPSFNQRFLKPLAKAEVDAFLELQKRDDVLWTYVCPPFDFKADGSRTGHYKIGKDEMLYNNEGKSTISYADYAIAMVDEAISGKNICKRISVVEE